MLLLPVIHSTGMRRGRQLAEQFLMLKFCCSILSCGGLRRNVQWCAYCTLAECFLAVLDQRVRVQNNLQYLLLLTLTGMLH